MKTKTIFFDKDGTLMQFDLFWVSVSRYAIESIFKKYLPDSDIRQNTEKMLTLLGVTDDKTAVDSVLCKGTYEEMAEVIQHYITEHGGAVESEFFQAEVIRAYNQNAEKGVVVPTCENIRQVLAKLQNKGIDLCVVTTDNAEITRICLEKLNIADMFRRIYTDDGTIAPKPDSACITDYCAFTGAAKENIVMVGDTETDVRFAKNAGISVVCVGDKENLKRFSACADATVSDISCLYQVIEVL